MGALLLVAWPAGAAPTSDLSAIQSLLDRRSAAVMSGDLDAFMATVGDRGSSFGRAQARWFRNLRAVPLSSYELELVFDAYGDLARPSDVSRYPGASAVIAPLTIARYRIAGYDKRPAVQELFFTFVERNGRWAIASDTDLEDLGFLSARDLWDFGPVHASQAERTTTISPASEPSSTAERIDAAAADALTRVDQYWTEPWPGRVPIVAPTDPNDLGRIIQATYEVSNYVAFSFWTDLGTGSTGGRIIVNPDGFSGASNDRAVSILTHELVHIATLSSRGPFIPQFIDEGLAQYVQYDGSGIVIGGAAARADGILPLDHGFFDPDLGDVQAAYAESLSAVGFFVDRWGFRELVRFYVALGRRGDDPGTAAYHVDRVLQKTIGVDLDGFERLWASSIGA